MTLRLAKLFDLSPQSIIIGFVLMSVGSLLIYLTKIDAENKQYVYSERSSTGRGIGRGCEFLLGFLLIPISKSTIVNKFLGTTVSYNARYHKLIGTILIILTIVHVISMAVGYFSYDSVELLFSKRGEEYPTLYASIALLISVVSVSGIFVYTRKKFFTYFYVVL